MTYKPSRSVILKLWKIFGKNQLGRWVVSKIVCIKAPYFNSIKPIFDAVSPGFVELHFKKRRCVLNHLKSVHAIAMCNAAELAGGICVDVSLGNNMRWIPIAMNVQYLKKAKTDLRAVCKLDEYKWDEPEDIIVPVSILDTNGIEVFHADITMRISLKRNK
jgi:acyl-coenzyme A thioesterase PaaI-like protein